MIGLAVADRLAAGGAAVTVLERGRCGLEASWAGAGILSPCSWHRDDPLAEIHRRAILEYEAFTGELLERTGIDPQFERCGAFKLLRDDNRMGMARREVEVVGGRLTPGGEPIVQTLTPAEAGLLEPNLTRQLLGVQHCRLTAQVRNPRLLAALQASCVQRGVDIREGVAVFGLLRDGEAVRGVQTGEGLVSCGRVVLCAGAWSSSLDRELGRLIPVYPVRGQILLLRMEPRPFQRVIQEGNVYLVARRDGHVLAGATEEHDSGYNRRTTAAGIAMLSRRALEFVPILAQAEVVRAWAGLRPGTPDRRPFMGEVPGFPGLIAATGHFRTGLTTAPVVAEIVADLLLRGVCAYDLSSSAPGRRIAAETPLD